MTAPAEISTHHNAIVKQGLWQLLQPLPLLLLTIRGAGSDGA